MQAQRTVRLRGAAEDAALRPLVYAAAAELSLNGSATRQQDGVLAHVRGPAADVEAFCARLRALTIDLDQVSDVTWRDLRPGEDRHLLPDAPGFVMAGQGAHVFVGPDTAVCERCWAEFHDPHDRRHHYAFISCADCGPRYSLVRSSPPSRATSTMAAFEPCALCRAEHDDPHDRRYRDPAVSCPSCGPVTDLVEGSVVGLDVSATADGGFSARGPQSVARARDLLLQGQIVAVKGPGGYHLVCDATDTTAVRVMQERRRQSGRPVAVMAADLSAAAEVAEISPAESALLTSARAPQVMVMLRPGPGLSPAVDLGRGECALQLPSDGLHRLLLALPEGGPGPRWLAVVPGAPAGEPMVTDDAEALTRLSELADAWLGHDRAVLVPGTEALVRVVDGETVPVRLGRGRAPAPVRLPVDVLPVLAVGADQENTPCLAAGRLAWLAAPVGDMEDLATQRALGHTATHLERALGVPRRLIVADRHPGHRSGQWALRESQEHDLPLERVQHHHAHLAAVMAEHGLDGAIPVIGVVLDGTGYGEDRALWGGEVLLAGYDGFRRFAHLAYVPQPGGDAAARRPYRMALSHLTAAGVPWDDQLPCVAACPPTERQVLEHQVRTGLACVPTSSTGRLFDAVASITGLCHEVTFEGQGAELLQAAAQKALRAPTGPAARRNGALGRALSWVPGFGHTPPPPPVVAVRDERPAGPAQYTLALSPAEDAAPGARATTGPAAAPYVFDTAALMRAVAHDVLAGRSPGEVALAVHEALAEAVVAAAVQAHAETGLDIVALSGSLMTNPLLLGSTVRGLRARGFRVLTHRVVPPGDGGVALGQVMVAARRRLQ